MKARRVSPAGQDLGLLYFTTNSLLMDDSRMVLVGKRNGVRNLYLMNVDGTGLRRLTDIPDDTDAVSTDHLKSPPVYSGGMALDNIFGEPTMDCRSGNTYYLRGRSVMKTGLDGVSIPLALLPIGAVCGVMHVSDSGRRLLVATTDQRVFTHTTGHGFSSSIDEYAQMQGISSVLRVYDTTSGEQILRESVPRCWITHAQFHPQNESLILYNHEWPSDCGIRRMWLFDGDRHTMVRTDGGGNSKDDWTCHEMWNRAGDAFIYHGQYHDGAYYLGRARLKHPQDVLPLQLDEVKLPPAFTSYGHFTCGRGRELYTDGYYHKPGEQADKSRYICRVDVDWESGQTQWTPLCLHHSSFTDQDSHPHPVLNHRGDKLYFNADFEGHRAVYCVDVE